jgi:hypothetical protein
MDKPKLNFVIDALMFLCLMALAGLGFLMKFALPSGREAWAKYGSNLQFSWLGWDRPLSGLHFVKLARPARHPPLATDPESVQAVGPRPPAAFPDRPDLPAPQPGAALFSLYDLPGQ